MTEPKTCFQNRYTILDTLARGGTSTVYLVFDSEARRHYAMKLIRHDAVDERMLRMALQEANLLRTLSHPSIPRVYDSFEVDGCTAIVMDRIEGVNLEQLLRKEGPQDEAQVIEWGIQLAGVLQYLHNCGILYRDLKPGNVLLGSDERLFILDFGAAIASDKVSSADSVGTRGFAAPEMYSRQADHRTDIYALGKTMHYLLTGIEPSRNSGNLPVRQWRPELTKSIEAVIQRCVEPDPAVRYQSVAALLSALKSCEKAEKPRRSFLDFFFGRKKSPKRPSRLPRSNPDMEQHPTEPLSPTTTLTDLDTGAITEVLIPTVPLGANYVNSTDFAALYQELLSPAPDSGAVSTLIRKCCTTDFEHIPWDSVGQLYIITPNRRTLDLQNLDLEITSRRACMCIGGELLILHPTPTSAMIENWIASCTEVLWVLKVHTNTPYAPSIERFPRLAVLSLTNAVSKEPLVLHPHECPLSLTLTRCDYPGIIVKGDAVNLRSLAVEECTFSDFRFLAQLPDLIELHIHHNPIRQLPLAHLTKLRRLAVIDTDVTELPGLEKLTHLNWLSCMMSPICFPDDLRFPPLLERINLSDTAHRHLPEGLRHLKNLRFLELTDLELDTLPNWLPDLADRFSTVWTYDPDQNSQRATVCLSGTFVKDMKMELFDQPYEVIAAWFRDRAAQLDENRESPLNELKVVFLGDGGAGKSLTVARLLEGGAIPPDFDGEATPGISICHRNYTLDGQTIQVHFWDFGGQEILHSMHRMFLTQRTLYVVLLNVREDTQDSRARYWLHNIRSFADGQPVLMVLNQMDQNPNASINESGLRSAYPALTEIVRLSALKDTPEEFNRHFTDALLRQISKADTLQSAFLPAWIRLKERLRNLEEHYITSDRYMELSEECGVEQSRKLRRALLEWFNDLGVSFCYQGSRKLEDYVILRPDWITNAIYILLYNPIPGMNNGIVPHESIFRMLSKDGERNGSLKRVLPGVYYRSLEVKFVLDVIRQFRLSYPVGGDHEFIPMLCVKNEKPVAQQYALDADTLEFRIVYEYLPNNVIHRLMVGMNRELAMEHVWLTGALFRQTTSGLSAVVMSEGDTLILYVRSTDLRYPAYYYLDTLRDMIDRITGELNLTVRENQVVYKEGQLKEVFNYDMLVNSQRSGIPMVYSNLRKGAISIDDILRQTDHGIDRDRRTLLQRITDHMTSMQSMSIYLNAKEDDRNSYLRERLLGQKYTAMDQHFSGLSGSGKQSGELDLDIRTEPGVPWTIYEALNLKGSSPSQRKIWENHVQKLLDNYNANGLRFLISSAYVNCPKKDFPDLLGSYSEQMQEWAPEGYRVVSFANENTHRDERQPNHYVRCFKCIYDCGGAQTTVYHYFTLFCAGEDLA